MRHGELPAAFNDDDPDLAMVAANLDTYSAAHPCHALEDEDEDTCRARRGAPCPCWEEDHAQT